MPTLPPSFSSFLLDHHVVSLATVSAGEAWAASCFYAFEPSSISLIVLSSEKTRHGAAMLEHSTIAGTIAGQPTKIVDIRGMQFVARAEVFEYCKRHPIARLKRNTIWRVRLLELKLTDNAKLFGRKIFWQREDRTEL